MVFNGGNNMQFSSLKKPTLTGFMLCVLAACGGESDKKTTHDGTNLTKPGDQADAAQAQSCEIGETKRDDGSCVRACRVDSNKIEYCLRNSEMPSDIDPTKKVAACKYGFFDNEKCKKVFFKATKDGVSLFAGETLRARVGIDELTLDRLSLGGFSGNGYQVEYDYSTEFPRIALSEKSIGNVSVFIEKPGQAKEARIVAGSFSDDPLSRAAIYFYGVQFEMGPMTKADFELMCKKLAGQNIFPERDTFKFLEIDSFKYVCGETPPSLQLQCEGIDCHIAEVVAEWQ